MFPSFFSNDRNQLNIVEIQRGAVRIADFQFCFPALQRKNQLTPAAFKRVGKPVCTAVAETSGRGNFKCAERFAVQCETAPGIFRCGITDSNLISAILWNGKLPGQLMTFFVPMREALLVHADFIGTNFDRTACLTYEILGLGDEPFDFGLRQRFDPGGNLTAQQSAVVKRQFCTDQRN